MSETGVVDPISFTKAEDYFARLDTSGWICPEEVKSISVERPFKNDRGPWRGITIEFGGRGEGKLCQLQFIRPTMWRVRFDPTITQKSDYTDWNTITIVGDHCSTLIGQLDDHEGIQWKTTLEEGEATAAMVEAAASHRGNYVIGQVTSLYIYKHPFRIQAARVLKPASDLYPLPNVITTQAASSVKTVWQTSAKTFRYKAQGEHAVLKPVILDVVKAGHGEFVGWGEQGGSSFMKKPSYMNYFNSDNMQYQQVYNQGPKDPREPLYHSDPFWLDVNSSPAHMNVTATFVDNPSQISVDFGKNNAGFIKVGTKFGMMDFYIISGDTLRDIVRLYTTIIGRGELKPRYVLGNHQACYGYMNKSDLENVVNQYRGAKIPLDGLHIDVPLQKNFRTFTVNEETFPQPRAMFQWLKGRGIKCSTNITPVISANDLADSYDVPKEESYFLKDYRYTKNAPTDILQTKYMCYKGGDRAVVDPINHYARPDFTGDSGPHDRYKDSYDLADTYNTGKYYHGGVSYGYSDGTPGHYADLNNPVIQRWWGTQYKDLFDLGLEFVWQDMTTPAIGENYGDMKGLPSRLLLPFKDGTDGQASKFKLAIEAWAIYSYNLHRATYRGLARLKGRENKRNFILGRGSYVGMYRYAGLWTGDNASTWDFWRITVPQVLSIGLNGVSICGADTGGFEPSKDASGKEEKICNPELIIRWYVGSTFLPWLRNHYVSRQEKRKWFQEPYAYPKHWDEKHEEQNLQGQAWLYYGVKHITRYYIQLRYSLMQLLYDTMFENQFHGLPIARSMASPPPPPPFLILTDPQDTTFFNETQGFLDNQYVVGQDILVAPIMHGRQEPDVGWAEPAQRCPGLRHARGWGRDVYFPLRYSWYQSNLAPFPHQRTALGEHVYGGTVRHEMARIPEWDDHQLESEKAKSDRAAYPDVLLHYIREAGAIIPQVEVKDFIDTGTDRELNPITLHVYPHIWRGKNKKTYTTYLDDGVSCSSAPKDILRAKQMQTNMKRRIDRGQAHGGSGANRTATAGAHWGRDKYRAVKITHGKIVTRKITIHREHDDFPPKDYIGESYTVILWYEKEPFKSSLTYTSAPDTLNGQITFVKNDSLRAFVVTVEETLGDTQEIVLTFKEEKE
ncbi:alpha-1,4-glucan lyase [Morchella snyderi]|nr:alpha-1,4-glucan lyase [Morchella snyderi]